VKLVSVDTNVLLRATLEEDGLEGQTSAARAVLRSDQWRCRISNVALDEYVYALEAHYELERPAIADLVTAICELPAAELDRPSLLAAVATYLSRPKLSFTDCLLAAEAQTAGAVPLWTFDRKLANQHPAAQLIEEGR
jgi:predicted nucleic-acid-binding protein